MSTNMYDNPDLLHPDKGFGTTGAFQMHYQMVVSDIFLYSRDENEPTRRQQMERQMTHMLSKKLSEHMTLVTHDGREYLVKVYWRPPVIIENDKQYQTTYLYSIFGYIVLSDYLLCVEGEYTRIHPDFIDGIQIGYSKHWGVGYLMAGRRIFKEVRIDGIVFHQCVKVEKEKRSL